MKKYKLFVYGTLMQNNGNNYLLEKAKFLGKASTVELYAMNVSGIPYVNEDEKKTIIQGELYEINSDILSNIDLLEGYEPTNIENSWYIRKTISIKLKNKIMKSFIYFNDAPAKFNTTGDFNNLVFEKQIKNNKKTSIDQLLNEMTFPSLPDNTYTT